MYKFHIFTSPPPAFYVFGVIIYLSQWGGLQLALKHELIRSQTRRQWLWKYAFEPLLGEKLWDGYFCLLHQCRPQLYSHRVPFETASLVAMPYRFCECNCLLLAIRGKWFGAHFSDGHLKSWGTKCVDKLLPGRYWWLGFIFGVTHGMGILSSRVDC